VADWLTARVANGAYMRLVDTAIGRPHGSPMDAVEILKQVDSSSSAAEAAAVAAAAAAAACFCLLNTAPNGVTAHHCRLTTRQSHVQCESIVKLIFLIK